VLDPHLGSDSILSSWLALEAVRSLWEEVVCVPASYIVRRALFCAAVKDQDIQLPNNLEYKTVFYSPIYLNSVL
jgi:hypothetical protein